MREERIGEMAGEATGKIGMAEETRKAERKEEDVGKETGMAEVKEDGRRKEADTERVDRKDGAKMDGAKEKGSTAKEACTSSATEVRKKNMRAKAAKRNGEVNGA